MKIKQKYAGIQYHGEAGFSGPCISSVQRIIHFGDVVNSVRILTYEGEFSNSHCLLIGVGVNTVLAIKSGFTSGYPGEGPRALSYVLALLGQYTENISEYIVKGDVLKRLDRSCLTEEDLASIDSMPPKNPASWYDYIVYHEENSPEIFGQFPDTLPLSILDERLIKFALEFEGNPDNSIVNAYRLLESTVRDKAGIKHESSVRLFSKAFHGEESVLCWGDIDPGESKGRATLFTSVFMAYRNRRAHRSPEVNKSNDVREFLLINQLFVLEKESFLREVVDK